MHFKLASMAYDDFITFFFYVTRGHAYKIYKPIVLLEFSAISMFGIPCRLYVNFTPLLILNVLIIVLISVLI